MSLKSIQGHYIYRRGSFDGKDKKGREGILVEEGDSVYFQCPSCQKIMKSTADFHKIVFDHENVYDALGTCQVCRNHSCESHVWIAVAPSSHREHRIVGLTRRLLGHHLQSAALGVFRDEREAFLQVYTTLGFVAAHKSVGSGYYFCGPSVYGTQFKADTLEQAVRKMIEILGIKKRSRKGKAP